jgi:hypothetical protein
MAKPKPKQKVKIPQVSTPAPRRSLGLSVQAFLHSAGVMAYIAFIAFLMTNAENWIGSMNTLLGPIAFLMLFTLSAAIVGMLVFGRPVMLYLDGKRKEAMNFVGATVGFLFIEALVIFIVLALVNA